MNRTTAALLVAGSLFATKAAAAPGDRSVAVLGIEPQDGASEELAKDLTEALRQRAAGAHGLTPVQGKPLVEVKLVFGCVDEAPGCLSQAGKALGVDKLLYGHLRKSSTAYRVTLQWLDVASAKIEHSLAEPISASNMNRQGIYALAVRWFTNVSGIAHGGTLQVKCTEPGAQIFIDNRAVGIASSEVLSLADLAPGHHLVRAEKSGFRGATQEVRLAAGDLVQVTLELAPAAGVAAVPLEPPGGQPPVDNGAGQGERPGRGMRIAFWTSVGVAAISLVGLINYGFEVGSKRDELKNIANTYQTMNPMAASTIQNSTNLCDDAAVPADLRDMLKQTCTDGRNAARNTDIFIGIEAAAALAAVYFYYRGYMAPGTNAASAGRSMGRLQLYPELYGRGASSAGGGLRAELAF